MDLEKNRALARRFFQLWGGEDLDRLDEWASPDLRVTYPAFPHPIEGAAAFKEHLAGFRSAFVDPDLEIEEAIAEDEKVVLRVSFAYTQQADYRGIRATGKRIRWTGIILYRIVDGRILEERGEEDYFGLFRQLGLLSWPPEG